MINLHERLSEFSYGYGVTREVEELLRSVGLLVTPFLPSLVQEKTLGFDVAFDKPGAVLMLQFKLGHSLRRFVRKKSSTTIPELDRPFWRFDVDTSEPEGQFETLLKSEQQGAEVHYVAPQFIDWSEYLVHFEQQKVLDNSLLVPPSWIRQALVSNGDDDGLHKVVYDKSRSYVCSEPKELGRVTREGLVENVRKSTLPGEPLLASRVRRVFSGLDERASVRRSVSRPPAEDTDDVLAPQVLIEAYRAPVFLTNQTRQERLNALRSRADSEESAVTAALGIEAWSLGIQTVLATAN